MPKDNDRFGAAKDTGGATKDTGGAAKGAGGARLLSLKEIQGRELEMLKLFVGLCEKNGLRYYMAGGTLLGAVRHGGFIPWDDDIDILMPRPDYTRLQELAAGQPFLPEYEFHSSDLGNLNDPMCKIFDMRTYVDKKYIRDKYDRHLWIDIFPMDGLPDDGKKIEDMYRRVLRLRRLLRFVKSKEGAGSSRLRAVVKPFIKPFALLIFGRKRIVRHIEKIAKVYPFEDSEYVGGIVFGYGPQEKCRRADYVDGRKIPFEGLDVMAPGCSDYYLTSLFGNYMELPPEDKRQVHFMKIYGW